MTLAHATDRLESARLVLRRIAPDDLPFFARIHAHRGARAAGHMEVIGLTWHRYVWPLANYQGGTR